MTELSAFAEKEILSFNLLSKLSEEQIKRRCSAYSTELQKKSLQPLSYALTAIEYKHWLEQAEQWFNAVGKYYSHHDIITQLIKTIRLGVTQNVQAKQTLDQYALLVKLVAISDQGHHLLQNQNLSVFTCMICHQVFTDVLNMPQIPGCTSQQQKAA
ncbi:MAG: hypothetical protein AABX37_01595 [Nanoarchaeota archaeon]